MTQLNDGQDSEDQLRLLIRNSFPDVVCSGPITLADEKSEEGFDECRALYNALRGRTWSQISASVIRENDYGLIHLTEEAFVAYMPAWLTAGVSDLQVGEGVVYTFVPIPGRDREFMDRRVQLLSAAQRHALLAFLTHRVQWESSRIGKQDAQQALTYISAVP